MIADERHDTTSSIAMFKIGDFAELAQVSTHRLRNYDKQGLLQPIHIDQFSGYRYYSAEQLGRLNRIIALLGLGLSLEEVKAALVANIDAEQLEQMLVQRQAQLKQEIAQKEDQLLHVHNRLQQIKEESQYPFEIVVKSLPAYPIASMRTLVKHSSEVHDTCNALYEEIHHALAHIGVQAESPTITLYHMHEFRHTDIDIEACVVVSPDALGKTTNARVQFNWLPAVPEAATLLFAEDCDRVFESFTSLLQWSAKAGYLVSNATREVHHASAYNTVMTPAGDPVVEYQLPIEKIAS
ncbi:MAG: MerR family transcriptional regulator [Chloroflexota bacterium]